MYVLCLELFTVLARKRQIMEYYFDIFRGNISDGNKLAASVEVHIQTDI